MNRSTRLSAVRALHAVALLATLGSGSATAMPFGAFATDQAELYLNAGPLIGYGINQSWSSGGEAPVTNLGLQSQNLDPGTLSGSGIFYYEGQTYYVAVGMTGFANASGYISNGALHAIADASAGNASVCATAPNGYVFECAIASAYANTYENWQDTLSVTGPANTAITLGITDRLLGQVIGAVGGNAPTVAYDYLQVCVPGTCDLQTIQITNSGTIDQTSYGLLTVYPGETLTLENQLILQTQAGWATPTILGSLDFSDTANSFVDVLTPGASIISASGVNYATPAVNAAPTPGTLVLVFVGVLALGIADRRTYTCL